MQDHKDEALRSIAKYAKELEQKERAGEISSLQAFYKIVGHIEVWTR